MKPATGSSLRRLIGISLNGEARKAKYFPTPRISTAHTGWANQAYDDSQIKTLAEFKDGKLRTAVAWKPNGKKCPVTNVKDGNGVVVRYNEVGTEKDRITYKDGEIDLESLIKGFKKD
jgi:antitoxin component YwqK of YwqJK toxin-antitoxin module